MDNVFIRFYNQNRQWFWVVIGTIVVGIVFIHILNSFVREKTEIEKSSVQTAEEKKQTEKNYSVISGEQLKADSSKIIDDFLNYCNLGRIEDAYNLLSKDCKEILYPSIESFTNNYYNKIFMNKKTYVYQAMVKNNNLYTYQINFIDDILETGKLSKTSIVDYYTIVVEKDGSKLNINKLIEKKEIPYLTENKEIEVKLEYKIVYYDYEVYSFNFKNTRYSTVSLDSFESPKNIFLQDENENKYIWKNYKHVEEELVLNKGVERNIQIIFNREYNPTTKIEKIIFQNVILNNEKGTNIEITIL